MALQLAGTPCRVVDCSFDLANPRAGQAQFDQQHMAGAVYAHLDQDLSTHGPDAASGGRHPLPPRAQVAAWLGRHGVTPDTQLVVYDRQGNNYCGRLWWMARWAGHASVAVLDGGLNAWLEAGFATESGAQKSYPESDYQLSDSKSILVNSGHIVSRLGHPSQTVLDARGAPRYRGDVEPLDPVAGHIPGALNRPFSFNMQADGRFKPAEVLRDEFSALLAGRDPATVVHHCGSGVSAIPNVLAMEIAGLGSTALYAGSWSDWCTTQGLPCAKG
jgi:thiosulfate/3-mercaptopyruvate sulfurtransferase